MTNENQSLEDQLDAAAKVLLKEVIENKTTDLQEKANLFKVVTAYYAIRQKTPKEPEDDEDDGEDRRTISQLGDTIRSLHGRQNGA